MHKNKKDVFLVWISVSVILLAVVQFQHEVQASGENWLEKIIEDTPSAVTSVSIGDADNDGSNEVVIGMWDSTNEVRLYEKAGGSWTEEVIVSAPESIYSLAIGDADNDGKNEVVIGMVSTTNE
ncbi:MAG: VCBS repeat-containing protein, partial [Methanomassiliicoccales archaeon]